MRISSAAAILVGHGKLVDPCRLAHVFASPRERVQTTLKLLLQPSCEINEYRVTVTEDITEWNYGKYEGWTKKEIRDSLESQGWDKEREWDVWLDGCEGGE